ncbi:MAG: DUF5381 family protein [Clostridia bacterium]|nr:DUF5381 family protein [Clostridia bacterium]
MRKYTSRATRWLAIVSLICSAVLLIGVILIFAELPIISVAMVVSGGILGIVFFSCFLAEKNRALIIDIEKIIFPRGADKNGKIIFQKTVVKFCDIDSIDAQLRKGDGLIAKDTYFYTMKLKDGTRITVTLYAYGKYTEKEIFETMKDRIIKNR